MVTVDEWYDNVQVSLMYVCSRMLINSQPKLAHEIALWHLSMFSDVTMVESRTYIRLDFSKRLKDRLTHLTKIVIAESG